MKHVGTCSDDDDIRISSRLLSRRRALQTSGGLVIAVAPWLLGCKSASGPAASTPDGSAGAPPPLASSSGEACALTHDNIEGPYYRAGAPDRWDLVDAGMPGVPLAIEGRVTTADCTHGIADVELDVWQANASGQYDNDGSLRVGAERFLLRGRLRTDGDGRYRVRTIVPGRYLNGKQYRPSHVHVKLRASGVAPLTTQLYFPDDPYNRVDPFIHESLVMDVKKVHAGLRARFDFVLAARA